LLSNQRVLWPALAEEFKAINVPFEPPRVKGFPESDTGRLVLALMRITCNPNDYVAHRVILGLLPRVGIGTCNNICKEVIINNLNYRRIFYQMPAGVFDVRQMKALNRACSTCGQISTWNIHDTLDQRMSEIVAIITNLFGTVEVQSWLNYASLLPTGTTLEELRDFLWADTDEQQAKLLQTVYTRLNLPFSPEELLPDRVRVMTMHGVKGLSGRVVFIPGFEEDVFPGPWRQPYPGLILEAARLLYVSITRAQVACVISHAETRIVNGQFIKPTHCRFCTQLGKAFTRRTSGLSDYEVRDIAQMCDKL